MTESLGPAAGTCRCGNTRMEVSAPPLATMVCHCRGCQRMTSSAFSLSALIPAEAFRVTAGEPVRGGLRGPDLHHYFCPDCMSWMFTRIDGLDDVVNVRTTLFDEPRWTDPFIETMTAEKLPWVQTPARHRYEGFPSMEDFQALIEAYVSAR